MFTYDDLVEFDQNNSDGYITFDLAPNLPCILWSGESLYYVLIDLCYFS